MYYNDEFCIEQASYISSQSHPWELSWGGGCFCSHVNELCCAEAALRVREARHRNMPLPSRHDEVTRWLDLPAPGIE